LRRRFFFAGLVLLLFVVLALGGCAPEKKKVEKAEGPKKGGILTFYIANPAYIDPYNAQESQGVHVVANVFDSLVDFDPLTSKLVPAVAESWEHNNDFTVWTFKLRKGTKFHNGREVKAQDFVYAWNRIASPKTDPPSDIAYHLAPVEGFDEVQAGKAETMSGVKAVDDYTLEVKLKYGFPDFIYVVGHPALAPVPKEEVEKDPKAFALKPIGNGPFMMAEPWKKDQYIKVKRFDDYYGTKPYLDGVEFKIFKDEQTAFLEFQAGKLDYHDSIPAGQVQAAIKKWGESKDGYTVEPGKQVLLGGEMATYYLNLNNQDKYLKNTKLRAAISLAINREAIVKTIFEGTRKPATGLVPPGTVGFLPDQGKYCRYDLEEAKKLLAEAGYPEGKGLPPLELSFNAGSGHEDIMQAVQANLKDIGINVNLKGMEWAQFLDYRQKGKHQIARDGWIMDYPIMDNMLYPLFYSKNIGMDNTSRYSNPEVDRLLDEARKEPDENKRISLYQQVEKLILDDAAVVPVVFYSHRAVAQKWVRGLVYSPMGLIHLEKVWLEK